MLFAIGLGLLFFVVAKVTDLKTAALVGAAAGILLVVVQRFVKNVDLLGGLALFGVVMMLISASFAIAFDDDYIIKLRSTIVGLIGSALFVFTLVNSVNFMDGANGLAMGSVAIGLAALGVIS